MSLAELHSRSSKRPVWRILGVRLLPLTVGHIRNLEDEECDPVRTPGDLGTAIRICSMPSSKWNSWKNAWSTPVALALWGRLLRVWDFDEKARLWYDYVRWHTELPVMKFKGSGKSSVLPSYRFTRVKLLRLGYSTREIDDTPHLDALWDITAAMELDGNGEALGCTEAEMDEHIASVDFDAIARKATEDLAAKLRGN